jgi:hypothetical protein
VSSTATHRDVLGGRADWSAECADALAFLRSLPDDSVDLLFTSPPYRKARTYGIGAGRGTEEWTAWMVEVVRAAAPKVKGLVAVNCEGQTEDYQYHPTPYLLLADLHRAGFNARRPAFFHRVGIPGSGGPDWLRADIEPIICITRPGKLPWSDNTACGHPPKWAPGGEMSNRLSSGTRVNQWGKPGVMTGTTANGNKEKPTIGKARPSHITMTKADKLAAGAKRHTKRDASPQENGDALREQAYLPPVLANPGNVISCTVGGGQMGHATAHENEAPFPLELPTFFVLSFCPPGGVVCDPFGGSFTTAHAAVNHGRRFVGCDVRESQVDLGRRRLRSVTPALFSDAEVS